MQFSNTKIGLSNTRGWHVRIVLKATNQGRALAVSRSILKLPNRNLSNVKRFQRAFRFTALSAKDRLPRALVCAVPWFPVRRMNGLVPQQRSPHLSRQQALGAGCQPSFPAGQLPRNNPHAAFGKLHRTPVHGPPSGSLQHFPSQPSRALQGASVHPVQRRGHQTALHVPLGGHRHTNTGGSAGRRHPAPARSRTQRASTSPAATAPGSAQRALPRGQSRQRGVARGTRPFPPPPPEAREPSPGQPPKAHALSSRLAVEGGHLRALRRRSRPLAEWGRGAWPGAVERGQRRTRLLRPGVAPARRLPGQRAGRGLEGAGPGGRGAGSGRSLRRGLGAAAQCSARPWPLTSRRRSSWAATWPLEVVSAA